MAETITLSIRTVGSTEAIQQLQTIQQLGQKITATPVKLQVDTSGIDSKALNALSNLTQAQNQVAVASEKTAQAQIDAEAKVQAAVQKTTQAQEKATQAQNTASTQTAETTKKVNESTKAHNLLGDSLTKIAARMAVWQIMGSLISAPIRAFKEALQTMKQVDSELVIIKKVTQATTEEIARMEEQAYKTASAYGVSADQYLSSVAEFSRAGYKDQSEALAELAVKTQLVGDTDEETANQFLLSVDAAYQYKGSVEELSKVLDGANEIDNNYATSIEKIAEGMGKVSSIAAAYNVETGELASAIGTITAVTQRSGTEAATALRALFLNIAGAVGEVIDEETGELVDAESVEKAQGMLKDLGIATREVRNGIEEIRNPMDVIGDLADMFERGALTGAQLSDVVIELGGKLRSNQLMAIIQNWDMYESMLADFGNSVGSADSEVENALDSWEAKTNILKNTWTEFISNTISTDWAKGLLDGITSLIEGFGSLGNAAITFGGILLTLKTPAIATMLEKLRLQLGLLKLEFKSAGGGAQGFLASLKAIFSGAKGAQIGIGLLTAAITIAIQAYNRWKQAREEAQQAAIQAGDDAQAEAENIQELNEKYEAAVAANDGSVAAKEELTTASENLISALAGEGQSIDDLIEKYGSYENAIKNLNEEKQKSIEIDLYNAKIAAEEALLDKSSTWKNLSFLNSYKTDDVVADFAAELGIGTNWVKRKVFGISGIDNVDELIQVYDAMVEAQENAYDAGKQNTEEFEILSAAIADLEPVIDDYNTANQRFIDYQNGVVESTESANDAIESNTTSILDNSYAILQQTNSLSKAKSAIEDYNNAMEEGEKGDTFKQYATIYDEFLEDWENGRKGSNAVQAAIKSFFNEDFISGMNYDLEELGEALAAPFFQGVFSAGGEDYGQNFLNLLYDTYGPEIRGENGKLIASFEEVDGTLSYMFNDMDALAEMLGVQPELLESVTDALGIYSTALDMTDEQLVDSLKKLNNFKDVLSTDIDGAITSVNFDELIKGLAEIGASDEEIAQLVNHFRELGVLEGAPENVEELGAAIEQLKEDGIIDILEQVDQEFNDLDGVVWSVGDGITHIDAGKLAYQLALIKDEDGAYQYTAEQIQNIISRIQEMEGMDIVNLPSSIEEVVQSAQNAQNAITDTKSDAEDLNNTEAEPKIDLDISNAESKRDQVYAILANIGKASATAKVYIQTEEISKNAKGTNDFEGGKTLVNEEGGELIVEGDRAFIANGGNPTILDLEPGTKIYTAEETKNILNGKNLNGAISARARGSGVPLGYYDSTSSSSSSASSSSGSSSSSSSGSYSSSSSSSSYSSNTSSSYDSYEDEQESIEDAQEAEIERLEDIVSLRQSELDLMQAQGKPIEDQIAKMKQIQAALHNQAEYMRSIGYSQEEINQLSTEWWNIQEEIKGVQQSLMDELTDALNRELENAEKEKDREIEAIDEEIEKLRNARDLEDEQLDLEEKKLAVLEAQEALVEAQNERTIRMYNASTGQWEWVADASSVQSAEESLKDAQEALKDYEEEQEYEAQIAALEARKEALESAYESLSDELDGIAESMEEPGRSISEILKDIATNGTPQMKATISETNKLLEGLNWYIAAATGQTTGDSITGGSNGNYSGDKVDYAALLLSAGSQEEMEYWAEQRQKKIEAQGLNPALSTKTLAAMWKQGMTDVDNIDYAALMMAAETLDEFQYFAALREKKIADLGITNVKSNSELKSEWAKAHGLEANASGIYDSGGILHGVGGIKATTADEMIMPPELTAHMLSPIADDIFRERIAALGWMYGAQDSIPQAFLGRSNTQNHNVTHNDGCYYFNGVQIGAKEANTMTIAQLAQQMQKLSLYKN